MTAPYPTNFFLVSDKSNILLDVVEAVCIKGASDSAAFYEPTNLQLRRILSLAENSSSPPLQVLKTTTNFNKYYLLLNSNVYISGANPAHAVLLGL